MIKYPSTFIRRKTNCIECHGVAKSRPFHDTNKLVRIEDVQPRNCFNLIHIHSQELAHTLPYNLHSSDRPVTMYRFSGLANVQNYFFINHFKIDVKYNVWGGWVAEKNGKVQNCSGRWLRSYVIDDLQATCDLFFYVVVLEHFVG